MRTDPLRTAWYRSTRSLRRRWVSPLTLVILIGLVGGLGLGGLAAARRTQASFSVYFASTNPSDFDATVYGVTTNTASNGVTDLSGRIARIPGVRHVGVADVVAAAPLSPTGVPEQADTQLAYPEASENGLFFNQDRVAVVRGHMADPRAPDQIMMPTSIARALGFHLGQSIPWGFYTVAQTATGNTTRPAVRLRLRLVALIELNNAIVQDDIDQTPSLIIMTPALADLLSRQHDLSFSDAATYGVQVKSPGDIARVEHAVSATLPSNTVVSEHDAPTVVGKADRAVKPIAIALGVFGAVALLAALLIAALAMARRLSEGQSERDTMRALGAGRATTLLDGFFELIVPITLGSVFAVMVAALLSPLAPLGPVRSVYPSGGFAVDRAVLGLGFVGLMAVLVALALVLLVVSSPHRRASRGRVSGLRHSTIVSAVASTNLPVPATMGIRMALEPGAGRTSVPVRPALLAMSVAVSLVVATLTFGSGLQTLVTHPSLYGWDWTYMFNPSGATTSDVPLQAIDLLHHDHLVSAETGVNYQDADIDGQHVPFIAIDNHASLTPPILSGHAIEANNQVVLGAATMAQLHVHVGGTVVLSYNTKANAPEYVPPTRLHVVGTGTLPAIGFVSVVQDHTSMGTGALVSNGIFPKAFAAAEQSPYPALNGPNLVLVRVRAGVSQRRWMADAERIARAADSAFAAIPDGMGAGDTLDVLGVQRPAEIVDYRTIGVTPALLGAGLALGSVGALGATLMASVRRRRRDLALLRTLGFTQRQLTSAVAWQATTTAAIGVVIGIPVGILIGRWLWILFARLIYAVPEPTVPWLSVTLVGVGALVIANLVATIPGRLAARTPAVRLLRGE